MSLSPEVPSLLANRQMGLAPLGCVGLLFLL